MPAQSIPVLNLGDFRREPERFAIGAGKALADLGFFALEDHGVDAALIRRAYDAALGFFTRPESEKLRYEDLASKGQRGFTRFGREHARDHPDPDLKEFWHVGREGASGESAEVFLPNVWPEGPAEFRPVFAELYLQLDRCACRILEAVALYLHEPHGLLTDMTAGGDTILRIIHYPPVKEDAPPRSLRAAPHEDINLITLLCEATAGGLELLSREGEWVPIHAEPGQIIVDAGDMLQNLTNGLLRSTTHRVVNPTDSRERRLSMPLFVHPRSAVSLAPLPGCVKRLGKARYPDVTAGEYLRQRLAEIGVA